ncbi:MAG: YggT family protein [Actinomycetota bacterium]
MLGQIAPDNVVTRIICVAITIYWFILFARIIWSWFPVPYSGPGKTLHTLLMDLTNPVLKPLSKLLPPIRAGAVGLDLSPIIAFVILMVLRTAIC